MNIELLIQNSKY